MLRRTYKVKNGYREPFALHHNKTTKFQRILVSYSDGVQTKGRLSGRPIIGWACTARIEDGGEEPAIYVAPDMTYNYRRAPKLDRQERKLHCVFLCTAVVLLNICVRRMNENFLCTCSNCTCLSLTAMDRVSFKPYL